MLEGSVVPILAGFFVAWYVFQNIPQELLGFIIAATAGLIIKEDIIRKGPGYVLSNGGGKVHVVSDDTSEDAIRSVLYSG
jgi:hypothetical protein